jgi:hypothetical protein
MAHSVPSRRPGDRPNIFWISIAALAKTALHGMYLFLRLRRRIASSMVEQETLNLLVVGSSPTRCSIEYQLLATISDSERFFALVLPLHFFGSPQVRIRLRLRVTDSFATFTSPNARENPASRSSCCVISTFLDRGKEEHQGRLPAGGGAAADWKLSCGFSLASFDP